MNGGIKSKKNPQKNNNRKPPNEKTEVKKTIADKGKPKTFRLSRYKIDRTCLRKMGCRYPQMCM